MTNPYDGIIYGLFAMENLDTSVPVTEKVHDFMFVLAHYKTRDSITAWILPITVK